MNKSMTLTTALVLAGLMSGHSNAQEAELEETCFLILANQEAAPIMMESSVMDVTAPGAEPVFAVPEGEALRAVTCARSALRLAENDYVMALWGIPLIVYTDDEEGNRKGILFSIQDDQFAVEISQGTLNETDRAALVESLEGFYAALESDSGE